MSMGEHRGGRKKVRISFLQTLRLIRSDYQRTAEQYGFELTFVRAMGLTILPAMIALILYRLSHYFYWSRVSFLAWPLYSLNVMLTGADIVPRGVIGERCFLGHTPGTVLSGDIGKNASIYGMCGVGGGKARDDIGAGPGLPIIGDNVSLGVNSIVMGPVRIGDGAIIGACALVLDDVPAGASVIGIPARPLNRGATSQSAIELHAAPAPPPGAATAEVLSTTSN